MQFLEAVQDGSSAMHKQLSDVLVAQDFQDLTGQVIGRVITLVTEVENSLVDLIRGMGGKQHRDDQDALCAEGRTVGGEARVSAAGASMARTKWTRCYPALAFDVTRASSDGH